MKKMIPITVVVTLFMFSLNAQNYSIGWFKVAGGGGTGGGGQYTINGTTGQHDAGGPAAGGQYSLTGGFWSLSVLQTPGSPTLRIFRSGPNTVVLAWPAPSTGFSLQQNAALGTTNWVNVLNVTNVVGAENQVTISPAAGNKFFRLSYP